MSEITNALVVETFNDLMTAVDIRLKEQFDFGRVAGDDYAAAYARSMNAAMQSAVSFQLSRQKATADSDAVLNKTVAELDKQFGYSASIDGDSIDIGDRREDGLIDEQTSEIVAKVSLIGEQENQVISQTSIQEIQSDNDTGVKEAQVNKIGAEESLLGQKEVSESAQTNSSGLDENSVLGRQANLYGEQANGFFWNARKGWAKLTVDAAAVDVSQDASGDNSAMAKSNQVRLESKPLLGGGTCEPGSPCS